MLVKFRTVLLAATLTVMMPFVGGCAEKPSKADKVMQEVFLWSDGRLCEIIILQHKEKAFRHLVGELEKVVEDERGTFELTGERLVCTPFTRRINSKNSTLLPREHRFDWYDLWLYRGKPFTFIKPVPYEHYHLQIVPSEHLSGFSSESRATNWTELARAYKFQNAKKPASPRK